MKIKYLIATLCLLFMGTWSAMAQTANTLSIPDVSVAPGKAISLPVVLNNTTDVVAVQFTLVVPEGIELNTGTIALSERDNGHSVTMKQIESQKYMVMMFSPSNQPVLGRTGTLLTVELKASSGMAEDTEHSFVLSDVIIADKDGKNQATGFSAGKLHIIKLPDLEVSDVTTVSTGIKPGDHITVNWQVRNIGGLSTSSGWSEQIYLDDQEGVSKQLTKVYYNESLAVGGAVSRSADILVPQLLGLDGEATLRVKLVPGSDTGEPSWLFGNNEASAVTSLTVGKSLEISPAKFSVDEVSASTVKLYVSRSGNTINAETYAIEASADSRVTFPAEVTVEKGQSGAYFYAQLSANKVLDKDSIVNITVTGNGYPSASAVMVIEDDTDPSLTLTTEALDVTEGESIELKIGAERISSEDIKVNLYCDESSRFVIPSSIVIPAGESFVTVSVEAREDEIPDIEHVVTFTASADRYQSASINTVLLDNDVPTLQMKLIPAAVSEAAGPMGVNAVLRRTDNIDKTVTVKFSDDSNGGLYYTRQSVEMPAGVEELTVSLGPVDNAIVDGERVYNISAAVFIASCSCNANNGTSDGIVTCPLTVYDNDGPALTLTSSSSILKEGGEIVMTLSRNTDTGKEQTVTLSSEHETELEYPHVITIPAGQSSVAFTVKSKGNTSTGDDFTATITAEAEGFAKGNVWFTVSDQTLPDAQITNVSLSVSEAEVNSQATFSFTLYNSGSAELPELTEVCIFQANSSVPLATAYLQTPLAVGDSVVMSKDITLPGSVGEYCLYAKVNDGQKVKELLYTNNVSAMLSVKMVSPYTTTVQVDKTAYNQGESIIISGKLQGTDIAHKKVEVYIINSGYRHVVNVESKEDGTFQTSYKPYDGQIGHFVVGACFPGEQLADESAAFDIYGMKRTSNSAITNEILLNEVKNGVFAVSNPAQSDLTGLTVKVISKPDNCNIQIENPQNLQAGRTADIPYTLTANAVSGGNDWEKIELLMESNEGASLPVTLYYYCRNKSGELKASVARINTTMTKDSGRDYPFMITNIGKGETGKISLALPSWMSSVTPVEIASLESGASATIILRFVPTEDMQLNVPVTGTIGINCENGLGLSLPYNIEPVSETKGTLTIDVCDEYTYYTKEAPHVKGAEVIVSHPTTGAVTARGITGTDGKFSVELPEGYYAVSVTASKHNSYRNNVLVDPGKENTVTVNLSYEAITIDYKVEETEIEDEYEMTTTVNYETSVPVPVVKLTLPSRVEAKSLPEGESLIFYATLTNKGLIAAQNVELLLPEGFKTLSFEALSHTEPFTLAPQQSVSIPVKITRLATGARRKVQARDASIDDDPCVGEPGTLYYWDCGNDRKWHRYGVALQLGSCKSKDKSDLGNISGNGTYGGGNISSVGVGGMGGRPSGIGGNSGYSSSTNNKPIVNNIDKGCEPCQNGILIAGMKCAGNFVGDAKETLESLMGLFDSDNDDDDDDGNDNEIDKDDFFNPDNILDNIDNIYNQDNGIYELLETVASTFDDCVNAASSFDNAYKCYQSASKTVDKMFDDAVTGALGNYIPPSKLKKYKALGKKMLKWKKYIDIAADCANDFVHACDHIKDVSIATRAKQVSSPDYTESVLNELDVIYNRLKAFSEINSIIWGYEPEWDEVSYEEMLVLMDSVDYVNSSFEDVKKYKPESLSLEMFENFYNRRKTYFSGQVPEDIANRLSENIAILQETREHFYDLDYFMPSDYTKEHVKNLMDIVSESQNSVCSSITLQFSQSMVMTRQAFRGTLTVFNGNEDKAMENVRLTLEVKDEMGNLATSREFQINPESLKGFTGDLNLTDGWTLAAGETGVATILYIPTKYAAPMVDTKYMFGGSLSYIDPFTGLEVTRTLSPVTLTVKPSADLNLTYFMQRDIIGDDPLTEALEPSEEAEFSLLINNVGYGDATNVQMVTRQPEIIDNEKGLQIDFELMSSQLNGNEKTLALGSSVATDFGDIPAKTQTYAQWWIKSSLLGHFTDYDVKATHVTSYGNPDLSLLNEVTVHELIRSLEVERAGKKLVGFMTNDIVDTHDTPDMLYLSDGNIEPVTKASEANMVKTSATEYLLTVNPSNEGWNYGSITDPTYGIAELRNVIRQSDNKVISLRNFWQTDRTLRDGKDPLYENRIHFADEFTEGAPETYLLTFEPVPQLILEVASVEGVPAENEIARSPVETVKIMFNKPVQPETFTSEDITLTVQGVKQNAELISVSTTDNKTFTLDLKEINKVCGNGYYVLTVQTSGITDSEGYSGKNGKSVNWNQYSNGTVQFMASVYPESAGTLTGYNTGNVDYGTRVDLSAKAAVGYEFANWTVNGEVVSTDSQLIVTVAGDMTITANFRKRSYTVNIMSNAEGGSVGGYYSGNYEFGEKLDLKAVPDKDFVFTTWVVNEDSVSTDPTLSLIVEKDLDIYPVFTRDVFQQRMVLYKGWNWVSSFLDEALPVELFTAKVTRIVSQFDELVSDSDDGMVGGIDSIKPGLGYKIEAPITSVIVSSGHSANAALSSIPLSKGWNWIGYPYFENRSFAVIANAEEGDYIVAQNGFAEYADGYWEGTFGELVPGNGYLYKSCSSKRLVFDFQSSVSKNSRMDIVNPTVGAVSGLDIRQYPNTMNMIGKLYLDESAATNGRYRIYAMVGNELRGISENINDSYYLTVYGDEPVEVSFIVVDENSGETSVANETEMFRSDVIGSRKSPYAFTVGDVTGVESLYGKNEDVKVYSLSGVLLHSDATIETLRSLSPGIYIINNKKYIVK